MGIISIANSNNSDRFLLLFLRPLDRRYQIRFYSTSRVSNEQTHMTSMLHFGDPPFLSLPNVGLIILLLVS